MKINPEVIRVHKGLSPCTFWVNGYFFLCEIFNILQVYSCEGSRVFRICCLCWNSCFSVGKRIQPDSWITDSFPFSCLHLSILPQNNSRSQWNGRHQVFWQLEPRQHCTWRMNPHTANIHLRKQSSETLLHSTWLLFCPTPFYTVPLDTVSFLTLGKPLYHPTRVLSHSK